jgi:phosphatidylserine synthase 1
VTDARCTRVGTQCWVFGAILFTELIICIKFGKEIFEHTQILTIALWLGIQSILSMICLYGCVLYHRQEVKKVSNLILKSSLNWQFDQYSFLD